METKEEVYNALRDILVELFELDAEDIPMTASLYDDLDLDSIDAIDMIVKLQEMTGKKVKPEEFKSSRTIADVVDVVYQLVQG